MFTIEFNASDMDQPVKLVRAGARFVRTAEEKLKRAVDRERANHKYVNRSGKTEEQTRFQVVSDDGAGNITIEVEQAVDHASYLQKKDWSKFDKNIRAALDSIDDDFRAIERA